MERELHRERELLLAAIAARAPGDSRTRDVRAESLQAATGVPDVHLLRLLPELADEYGADVAVTGTGEIVWRFPARLETRRRSSTLRAALLRAGRRGLEFLRVAFGFGYSLWFLAASLFAALVGADNLREKHPSQILLELRQPRRLEGPEYEQGADRAFHETIFSFIFGPGDPDEGRREGEARAFLAWAARRKGLVSPFEYALREGLPLEEAERRVISFAAEFGASAVALGPGHLAWRFRVQEATGDETGETPRYRRLPSFSDNAPGGDFIAAFVSFVNLAWGAFCLDFLGHAADGSAATSWLVHFLARLQAGGGPWFEVIRLVAGWGPLLLGLAGSGIAVTRALALRLESRRRLAENERIYASNRLLAVLDGGGESVAPPLGEEHVPGEVPESREGIAAALGRLAAEYGASPEYDADGRLLWRFAALVRDAENLRAARAALPAPGSEGPEAIIFDSGERLGGEAEAD